MIVAIVGSREWPNPDYVATWIDGYLDDFEGTVISGGATGVDTWVQEACDRRGIHIDVIRPKWRRPDGSYNKRAGFERNVEIITRADRVVVIWNGTSGGSRDDIDIALRLRKPLEINYP